MRTTLTIDDDVATMLDRLRKKRGTGLKYLVNEALRRGLRELEMRPKPRTLYRTRSVDLGRVRIASIDNISDVLAIAEGEDFR